MQQPIKQIYADVGTINGKGDCALKYKLYKQLANKVPHHIYELMVFRYDEDFVAAKSTNLDREQVLEIKEEIDDYLEDVQYRVQDRLDWQSLKRLKDYHKMEFPRLVDKLNQIAVEERVIELIRQYENI